MRQDASIKPTGTTTQTLALITGTPLNALLLGAALFTAAIESTVFFLCGYRKPRQWLTFALINIVSNLLLNEFLRTQTEQPHFRELVAICEIAVYLLELALAHMLLSQNIRHLAKTLLLTNATSFGLGLVLTCLFW